MRDDALPKGKGKGGKSRGNPKGGKMAEKEFDGLDVSEGEEEEEGRGKGKSKGTTGNAPILPTRTKATTVTIARKK